MPASNSQFAQSDTRTKRSTRDDATSEGAANKDNPNDDEWVWNAMNDASRRKILDLLRSEALTTTDLCAHFDFSRFAVMKHLKVLEKANLILVERQGRRRLNHINPVPLQSIYRRWIKPFEDIPADRLLRLKHIAELNALGD